MTTSDDEWRATPAEQLVVVDVLERDVVTPTWNRRQFSELRKGDAFRAINADGDFINPYTGEPNAECVAVAVTDAFKSNPDVEGIPLDRVNVGYAAEIDVWPTMDDFLRGTAQ